MSKEQKEAIERNLESKKKEKEEESDEKLLNEAIKDEEGGVKLYERLLANCDDPEEQKVYKGIIADEKRHKQLLLKIKSEE